MATVVTDGEREKYDVLEVIGIPSRPTVVYILTL